jgi:predicted peroxiredoxin
MRITYFSSTGVGDPTRATMPLHIAASGSLEVGQEPTIVLAGDATELVLGDNAEKMEGLAMPPARELLGKLREHEVPVFV